MENLVLESEVDKPIKSELFMKKCGDYAEYWVM